MVWYIVGYGIGALLDLRDWCITPIKAINPFDLIQIKVPKSMEREAFAQIRQQ